MPARSRSRPSRLARRPVAHSSAASAPRAPRRLVSVQRSRNPSPSRCDAVRRVELQVELGAEQFRTTACTLGSVSRARRWPRAKRMSSARPAGAAPARFRVRRCRCRDGQRGRQVGEIEDVVADQQVLAHRLQLRRHDRLAPVAITTALACDAGVARRPERAGPPKRACPRRRCAAGIDSTLSRTKATKRSRSRRTRPARRGRRPVPGQRRERRSGRRVRR